MALQLLAVAGHMKHENAIIQPPLRRAMHRVKSFTVSSFYRHSRLLCCAAMCATDWKISTIHFEIKKSCERQKTDENKCSTLVEQLTEVEVDLFTMWNAFLLFPANVNVNEENFCLFSNELP